MYETSDIRKGLRFEMDGDPFVVVEFQFVKPGKGTAFTRTKIRNMITGAVLDRTYKSGEKLKPADTEDREMQYLYNDGSVWHFMDPKSFEQFEVSGNIMDESSKWIKEEDLCEVTLWNGAPLSINPPTFVILKIVETDPGLKGDTSGGGGKPATLETGAVVRVPLFVQIDELIKVDTRTSEYVSRAKDVD